MARKYLLALGPSLLMAVGIVVSTFVAGLAAASGWLVLSGPLLLALMVVGADVLDSRLRGRRSWPSPAAAIVGGASVLAGLIVVRDPNLVKTLIPLVGMAAWVVLLRPSDRPGACSI